MRWIALVLLVALAGCAGGVIMSDKPADPSKAAYIEVISADRFSIRPAQHPDIRELKFPGMWVSDGWFILSSWCFYPKNQPRDAFYDLGPDFHTIHFRAGHHYTLRCDPDVFAKYDLVDTDRG